MRVRESAKGGREGGREEGRDDYRVIGYGRVCSVRACVRVEGMRKSRTCSVYMPE